MRRVLRDAMRENLRSGSDPDVPETTDKDRRGRVADGLVPLSYAALAIWVMGRLWADPDHRLMAYNRNDHGVFLFFIAHGERVVFHGDNPLWSSRMNAPHGVNMMANTSMLAAGIPLAPLTHWFGPAITVALLLTFGLAGTAAAWYWFLSRHVVQSRAAAWVGGLFAGLGPGFVAQASGHPNFTAGFLIPFIVRQVLRLREPGRVWRSGIPLGLLVTGQIFLSEEMLLFCAIPLVVFVLIYAAARPRVVREAGPRFLAGGLVAIGVAGLLVAYPLWFQFLGPGHYRGVPFQIDRYATSLGSIVALPRESIAGDPGLAQRLSTSATEDNAFWGAGICVMVLISIAVLWRSLVAWALTAAGLIMLVMSFGTHFRLRAKPGHVPAPLGWIGRLPILDSVTVPRYALATTVVIAILLAMALDRIRTTRRRVPRVAFRVGIAVALLSVFPKPLPTSDVAPIPAFFADRMWKPYVAGGRSVVPIPLPDVASGWETQRIASMENLAFPVPRGYFIGPANPPADLTSSWSAPPTYTSALLRKIWMNGKVPDVDPLRLRQDLRYWKSGVVVLIPDADRHNQLQTVLTDVLGEPQQMGGVELWDTRNLS
jgi:hypothetical protein